MSFGRAKRFNYKPPDLTVSPADYNVQTNNLEKGVVIPKCPRFQNRKIDELGKSHCRRSNCSTSCGSKTTSQQTNPEGNSTFNKTDPTRASVRHRTFRSKNSSESSDQSDTQIKHMIENFEKLLKDKESQESSFLAVEEFIDDDYHSLTSSEELENLKKIEEYEFNEVCNAFRRLLHVSVNEISHEIVESSFESAMMEKLEELERKMKSFKQDFARLNQQLQVEDLEKKRNLQRSKVETLKRYFEKQISRYSKEKQDSIKEIITKAIDNLNKEFDNKRFSILKDIDNKIRNLIGEIYVTTNSSGREIKELCDVTANNLTKRLRDVMRPFRLALTDSDRQHSVLKEQPESTDDSFHYENICKMLSEQLQLTQGEKEALEMENLDMTLKCDTTVSMLETQASVIDRLNSDIEELKKLLNEKHH